MSNAQYRTLAPYACDVRQSRGRLVDEPESANRSDFQRDRDRIIHSTAFRRLKHKTQVFVYHEGDHFRTRLTHSLEVSQIARSMARIFGLDEDLTEALSLAHDLGHTPFGHAGESALDQCMKDYGGFDHNAQTVAIVHELERRYALFDGLNLTWETMEGLIKHNGPVLTNDGEPTAKHTKDGPSPMIVKLSGILDIKLSGYASAEAQAAALSDDIAYNAHDIDDGLRAGLFDVIDLADVPVIGEVLNELLARHHDLERTRLVHETTRRLINRMVEDVLEESAGRFADGKIASCDDVRAANRAMIAFSPAMARQNAIMQSFLRERMYGHEKVQAMTKRAKRVVTELFQAYWDRPGNLPPSWRPPENDRDESHRARLICDFIAGMTDRFALDEHRRLFDLDPIFR